MALIICPECNGKVSDKASACPHCGYPINNTANSNNSFDLQLINTVSRVKAIQAIHRITNMSLEDAKKLVDSKSQIIISNISLEKANMYKKELEKDMIEVSIVQHSNSKESPVEQIKKEPVQYNLSKCPMCGSTNIQKISDFSRASSILGFGILSKKIGKQWQCNNPKCKHLW